MRAAVWHRPGSVSVEELPDPRPGPHQVVVDVAYTGLCGTDIHIVDGQHPRACPGLVLGHEVVGRLRAPAGGLPTGSPVMVNPLISDGTCRACRHRRPWICERLRLLGIDVPGGAADSVCVDVDAVVGLPERLPLRRAAFTEPLAVAVHALRRSRLRLGQAVAVVGAGPIGQALVRCAQLSGAGPVLVSEPHPGRAALLPPNAVVLDPDDPVADLLDRTDGGVDVVFDAAAHPAVALQTSRFAAPGGTVVVVGTYPGPTEVDLQALNFRELRIVGTRVYATEDIDAAIRLLLDGRFDPGPLTTDVRPLSGVSSAFAALRNGEQMKILLQMGGS